LERLSETKEGDMKVGRVNAFAVRYPEPNNDGKVRSLTLVKIETDDGVVGWGEAITGAQATSLAVAFVVERRLAPMIVGEDPRDVPHLWQQLRDATYWDGNGGLVSFGISAIDMALWDVAGRAAGVPLYELLGGRRQDRVRACASTIFASNDLDRVASEFRGFVAQGYTAVKAAGVTTCRSPLVATRRAISHWRGPSGTPSGPLST
jgi:L-alanine-DL-glutamate epimerase-like enolase superfamily enzyme